MGIALFTAGGLFGPLHQVMGWFATRPRKLGQPVACRPPPSRQPAAARVRPVRAGAPHRTAPMPGRPLRVVRVVESCGAASGAGRMFMSGRMADVCAELDRLAALEPN